LVDSEVVDLSAIGVPQRRKRHVLLASLKMQPDIRGALNRHAVKEARNVMWGIDDLTSKSNGSVFDSPSIQTERNLARIAYLYDNGLYDLPNRLRPKCHRHGGHSYKSMYGRLYPQLPAQTITSGFGSPGQGRFVHPTEQRTLTPHEAARLQFFPDSFDFRPVSQRSALAEMIGNAVPMKLSFVLCLHLLGQS
jgi:DNA (cytosine-5)-methyltransferase 1